MAAPSVQNPPQAQSKSSKKKKAKTERTESPAPASVTEAASPAQDANSDEASESPYVRELSKTIRNVSKKITNASKVDGLIAENKDKSLDELVSLKIINNDQKAQHLKKPELVKQLAGLEDQLAQYKKIDQDYRARAATEKAQIERSLNEKHEKELAAAVAEVKDKAEQDSKKQVHDALLLVSQFLRLAAARRQEDANQELDENRAIEGVLLRVYSGDDTGVENMVKLVQGSSDEVQDNAGEMVKVTYAQVREAAIASSSQNVAVEESPLVEPASLESAEVGTDPTLAHATLTEIDQGAAAPLTNGHNDHADESASVIHPPNADVADSAANAAGESQWDTNNTNMSMSQEWVEVPRDPAETETGLRATPAAAANTQSWADEAPEPAPAAAADPNDGFSQVPSRNRGRGGGEGGHRGRGNFRGGRGFRGDGRGRGRGGRGGQPFRGQPRRQESEA